MTDDLNATEGGDSPGLSTAFGTELVESRLFSGICICGVSHLQDPKWPAECQPLHGFDQFHDLREVIFGSLNKGSVVIDTRIAQAQRFLDFVKDIIRQKTLGPACPS